jgi:Predicted membrane protein
MTLKQYKICRIAIVFALSMLISVSITLENYYLPIVFVITAAAAMYYCKKQLNTKEVMADERDYQIAGTASRYAISIYGWIATVGIFILMAVSLQETACSISRLSAGRSAFVFCFLPTPSFSDI